MGVWKEGIFSFVYEQDSFRHRSQWQIRSSLFLSRHLGSALSMGCICGRKGEWKPMTHASSSPHQLSETTEPSFSLCISIWQLTSTASTACLMISPGLLWMDHSEATSPGRLSGSPGLDVHYTISFNPSCSCQELRTWEKEWRSHFQ